MYNHAIQKLEIPARIRRLRVSADGFPVPRFVAWIDGKPDFRVVDTPYMRDAIKRRLCFMCGEQLGKFMAFPIGPMCAINRTTSEPPMHLECAQFAVKACPFLTQPRRPRNEHELPEHNKPAGDMIQRNPGVTLIWVTKGYQLFRATAGNAGVLIRIGELTSLEWWCRGRAATREEIMDSINSGLPALEEVAQAQGPEAIAALEQCVIKGLALVPA